MILRLLSIFWGLAWMVHGELAVTNHAPSASQVEVKPATTNEDAGARLFAMRCAGCHSFTGQKLNGPPLNVSASKWALPELKAAVKRMEKNAGALTENEVLLLADFIKAPDVLDRLKAEEARIAKLFEAQMDPPNAKIGEALFRGRYPLRKGGLACSSCHSVEGRGGKVGPDLTLIHTKMGRGALVSAIEKSAFKVMEPHYAAHPVTKQEALHLAEYLMTRSDGEVAVQGYGDELIWGAGGAVGILIVFGLLGGRKQAEPVPRLQRRRK